MQKARYYKAPKPPQKTQKQLQRPKPEWTTDFSDPDKYKLSQTEMIQRKAALQSKNRQLARQSLQQRRKKLQMGIIDQDTRKVYQTALTSKKIDLNPSIRKNLSQMIQYQKQKRAQILQAYQEENQEQNAHSEQENDDDIQKQVKQAQQFIKKLEKAKKQTNIQKAVDILIDEKKSANFGANKHIIQKNQSGNTTLVNNKSKFKNNTIKDVLSPDSYQEQKSAVQALSSIEQTIKYMQQKLFNPKAKKAEDNEIINQQSPQTISLNHDSFSTVQKNPQNYGQNTIFDHSNILEKSSLQKDNDNSQNEFMTFSTKNFTGFNKNKKNISLQQQLDELKINLQQPVFATNFKQQSEQQDDCMSTIRRMRQMIQQKQHLYDYKDVKHKQNNSKVDNKLSTLISAHDSQGDVEVDFSLTANQDQDDSIIIHNTKNFGKTMNNYNIQKQSKESQYQKLKKNLFDEADKLNSYSVDNYEFNSFSRNKNTSNNTISAGMGSFASSLQQQQEEQQEDDNCNPHSNFNNYQGIHEQNQEIYAPSTVEKINVKKKKIKASNNTNQLQELKGMISGNKTNIQKIQIQPIGGNGGIMGFDYRGSINIRKNLVNNSSKGYI